MSNAYLNELLEGTMTETAQEIGDVTVSNDGSKVDLSTDDVDAMLDGKNTAAGGVVSDLTEDLQLDDEQSLELFAESLEVLSEQNNIVRLNRQTRLLNLTNRSALVLAKRNGDPLYTRYARFNKIRRDIRAQIVKKYGSKASSYARNVMNKLQTGAEKK